MTLLEKIFQWLTLGFIAIVFFSMTFGQFIPIEFADSHNTQIFYSIIILGLPIATFLTLSWTIRKSKTKKRNILTGIVTILITMGMTILSIYLMFVFAFGVWVNTEILYENNENRNQTINQQLRDIGAFGYSGQRTVKLTPILGLWNITTEIDTANIDKTKWVLVQKKMR